MPLSAPPTSYRSLSQHKLFVIPAKLPINYMASSSCSLFLKRPHEAGLIELCIEDVSELTVQKLTDKVAEKTGLPLKEFRELADHL